MNKSIVIFDTNKLRSTVAGGPSYGTFKFSVDYINLKSEIDKSQLTALIDIGIPGYTLREIVQQKIESYQDDITKFKEILKRLSEIKSISISSDILSTNNFDIKEHIKTELEDFLKNENILLIEVPGENSQYVLESVKNRAIERKHPFRISGKSNDTGFKDVIIWESILNYEYDNYEKVFFITNDGVFDNECQFEFEQKFKKELIIQPSIELLLADLRKFYFNEIKDKEWHKYANSDYFKSYLNERITDLREVDINGKQVKIEHVHVVEWLLKIIEPGVNEDDDVSIILVSKIKGQCMIDNKLTDVYLNANTYLDDAKDIRDTEWEMDTND